MFILWNLYGRFVSPPLFKTAPLCGSSGIDSQYGGLILSGENLSLSLKGVIIGFLQRKYFFNYLTIIGKITIWECRKKHKIYPKLRLFLHKVEAKQEVEKIIAIKNRKLRDFCTRWEPLL